jgi:hypothetical protein
LVRIDGCGFGAGGQQAWDPGEEGDVNDHEGADINVGQNIGNGVGDLEKGTSVWRFTVFLLKLLPLCSGCRNDLLTP